MTLPGAANDLKGEILTQQAGDAETEITTRMANMVKGFGVAQTHKAAQLSRSAWKPDLDEGAYIERAREAEKRLYASVKRSIANPDAVRKSLNPSFLAEFPLAFQSGPSNPWATNMQAAIAQIAQAMNLPDVVKNISLTSPLSSGFVPFDLLAPTRLTYPMYAPLRNRVPRTQGQGSARKAKVITGIQGTGTGTGNGAKRISVGEFPGGGSFSNWPAQLPASGSASAVDISIPYKFFGISEAVSWLAQFSGQGFDDVAALASMILMQEGMLGEEFQILGSTGTNISAPAAPTVVARAAGTGETAITGFTTSLWVRVTAMNVWGNESASSAVGSGAIAASQVADVTISPAKGAFQYNLYVGTGAADPGAAASHLMASNVGGELFTLQGALPTTGATAPTVDGGTGSTSDYEGMISILSGHASIDGSVYPAGFQAGYVNQKVGTQLRTAILFTALQQLWDGNGSFRADPAELWVEGQDAVNLANDMLSKNGQTGAYQFYVSQDEVGGLRVGAAVSQVQNPITRSVLRLVVHPWLPQGTALLQTWSLPNSWSNVSNVWENTMVQDYLSVSWPVIDATFRYSLFFYGALVCFAPQYCGLLQGLQVSDTKPYA